MEIYLESLPSVNAGFLSPDGESLTKFTSVYDPSHLILSFPNKKKLRGGVMDTCEFCLRTRLSTGQRILCIMRVQKIAISYP